LKYRAYWLPSRPRPMTPILIDLFMGNLVSLYQFDGDAGFGPGSVLVREVG
jgi:hypothetical protein